MSTRALITGGAGFIGSHLAKRLLREGYTVRIFDDFSSGHRENLGDFQEEVEWFEGDIRNPDRILEACRGCDLILHQAAVASVPRSIHEPRLTHEVNLDGTFNVLLAARDASIQRVVIASSSSVYGETPTLPKTEGMPPAPVCPYAVHKLVSELYATQFSLHYGMEVVCLRYFNVFGPHQDPDSPYAAVIPRFVKRIQQGLPPLIFGDGSQTRDFTYVENAVEANLLASRAKGVGGQVFNIASGKQTTVRFIAEEVSRWMKWKGGLEFAPHRPGDILHSLADISLAGKVLGYKPVVSLEEGLRRTLEWYAGC